MMLEEELASASAAFPYFALSKDALMPTAATAATTAEPADIKSMQQSLGETLREIHWMKLERLEESYKYASV